MIETGATLEEGGTYLKVGVRSTWAVDTDVAGHCDVRTTMRLAHDSDNCNARGSANGLGSQLVGQLLLVLLWNGVDDVHCLWLSRHPQPRAHLPLDDVDVHVLALLVGLDDHINNLCDALNLRHHCGS